MLLYNVIVDPPLSNATTDPDQFYAKYNQSSVVLYCDICANPIPADGDYIWIANAAIIPNAVGCNTRRYKDIS